MTARNADVKEVETPWHTTARTDDRELGMDRAITRRDFLNGVAIGIGGALASRWLPDVALSGTRQTGAGCTPATIRPR